MSEGSIRAPPARCSVPPARALRSSRSSHLAAFSTSVSGCRGRAPSSSRNTTVVSPAAALGGGDTDRRLLMMLLRVVAPKELERRRWRVVPVDVPLSSPEDRRWRACDSERRPVLISFTTMVGLGCSGSSKIAARTGAVVGRCALRSGRGGGPVGVSGSPVGGRGEAGDVGYGELGELRDLAERAAERRRAGNALTAAVLENEGMVGDSERLGLSSSAGWAAGAVTGRRGGGKGRDGSSTEGEGTMDQSSSMNGAR